MTERHSLVVDALRKSYLVAGKPAAPAVDGVSFHVEQGEFFTLLGPSGCGKTTTLRAVAGLERPSDGRIVIDGADVFDGKRGVSTPTHQRDIGMVFQSYAIWPHMSVYENVAFPLKQARNREPSKDARTRRIVRALEVVGLGAFHDRSAAQLSGGQQQRLALARALVGEPRLLLLDEPLSNLDAVLREQMRAELRRVQRDTGVATLYVTHDQAEALSLSDRIAVISAGRIVQVGAPTEIYHQPANVFVAKFIGRANLVRGVLRAREGAACVVDTSLGPLQCRTLSGRVGEDVEVVIRPEALRTGTEPAAVNAFRGNVVASSFLGETTELEVRVSPDLTFLVRLAGRTSHVGHGAELALHVPPDEAFAVVVGRDDQTIRGDTP